MSRVLRIIFAVSLLLNFMALGWLFGSLHGQKEIERELLIPNKLANVAKISKDTEIRNLIRKLESIRNRNKEKHLQIKKISDEIYHILVAEEFNANLYDLKIHQIHELHEEQAKETSTSIRDLSQTLNQEERILLAEIMKNSGPPR